MPSPLRFQEALHQVQQAGEEINQYLLSLASPDNAEVSDPFHPHSGINLPAAIQSPRKRLAEAAAQLLQLATEPQEYLEQLSANNQHLVCLRWLVNLNILDHIPSHGSISYAELAAKAKVPERQLRSVARMAAAHGFLFESSPMNVSHSRSSSLLASDPGFLNWARFLTNYSTPSAYRFLEATQQWGQTDKKDETAFNIAMDVSQPFFDHLKVNTKMNAMFSSYMRNVASSSATGFQHLVNGFDWGSLSSGATVVDVGGSTGHASAALAKEFPNLKFIVQDLPETLNNTSSARSENADGNDRLQFMPHDFFTPQPITDADVYLLRMIIHDWPDDAAIKILSHIKDAIQPGARIVVMDTVLPQPGAIPLLQERQLRVRDLTMMQVFNAKEREYEAWEDLLSQVGLKIERLQQPEGSNMAVLEIVVADSREVRVDSLVPAEASTNGTLTHSPGISLSPKPITNGVGSSTNGLGPIATETSTADTQQGPSSTTTQSNAIPSQLPIIIIGAGISGLCLAQYLQRNSIPFLVFERDLGERSRPQGYRLKLESDAADALRESLSPEVYQAFETSCAISTIGETDFNPFNGTCIKSRAGGGLAGRQGLRASYTVDRTVFRRILMTGIHDRIRFGREVNSTEVKEDGESSHVRVAFSDGSSVLGRFLVGADGTRSAVRKHFRPEHKYVDTGAVCIYGKTIMTPELLQRFPAKGLRWMTVCADTAPLIQSILIQDSPLTLLSEPIRFSSESRSHSTVPLPDDYVYWVLIGRKELFADANNHEPLPTSETAEDAAKSSASQSLLMTGEWHPTLRSLFELQDVSQASTMRVVSACPKIAAWEPSPVVTLIGDAVHAMSPCGGVGANTALRDAAELGKVLSGTSEMDGGMAERVGVFEDGVRKRAFGALMRSYAGSKKMFDQVPFEKLSVVEV